MGNIQVLSFEVANLIAAGEVVDRPASAIKEMMENAIDAGAKHITVEIQNGGVRLMRVTDDGCGMSAEDLPMAVRRHATSKIKDATDLDGIITLGFRGEALAAISSVSDMRIISKRPGDPMGAQLEIRGGTVLGVTERGCRDGTTVIVENLFSMVPARRKFLKRDATEAMAVAANVERVALSHPEIAVRFLNDGVEKLDTAGDGQLKSAVWAVYGRDFASRLIPVFGDFDGIQISGFIGRSDNVKSNRNGQNFFINHRYVKSRTAQAALEQAFVSYLLVEKYPCCIINIGLNPARVDVNVHPAKLEVKFSNEKPIFEAVYYAVRQALEQNTTRPTFELPRRDGATASGQASAPPVPPHQATWTQRGRVSDATRPIETERPVPLGHRQMTMDAGTMAGQKPPQERITAEEYIARYVERKGKNHPADTPTSPDNSLNTPAPHAYQPAAPAGSPDSKFPFEEVPPAVYEAEAARLFGGASTPAAPTDGMAPESASAHEIPAEAPAVPPPAVPTASVPTPALTDRPPDISDPTGTQNRGLFYSDGGHTDPAVPTPAPEPISDPAIDPISDPAMAPAPAPAADPISVSEPAAPTDFSADAKTVKVGADGIPYRFVGEVFHCYLIVEKGDTVLLIDKHAAHERLNFEKLKAKIKNKTVDAQMLMFPIEVMLMSDEVELLDQYRAELESIGFGFTCQRNTVQVNAIPFGIEPEAVPAMFGAFAEQLGHDVNVSKLTRDAIFEKALFQASCKASIKGGRDYPEEHIEWLVDQLMALPDITFCPHGRPVAMEMKKRSLDHQFERC